MSEQLIDYCFMWSLSLKQEPDHLWKFLLVKEQEAASCLKRAWQRLVISETLRDRPSVAAHNMPASHGYLKAMPTSGLAIVVMGVSGSGKSLIGSLLAKSLGCPFLDADDFHSQENKEAMRSGIPLTDADRLPWLEAIRDALSEYVLRGMMVVLACSALKLSYRNILRNADYEFMLDMQDKENATSLTTASAMDERNQQLNALFSSRRVPFFFLHGSFELFSSRLEDRLKKGAHFMPPDLLKSQMDTLDMSENEKITCIDASLRPEVIVDQIRGKLGF